MPKIGPDKVIPFIIGNDKEAAKEPTPTQLGRELYDAVSPLAYDDPDWDLLNYCDALVQAGQQAATYGRDSGDIPGWGILMDPATCPPEALVWLGQIVGADVGKLQRGYIVADENMLWTPSFKHVAINGVPSKWSNNGTAVAGVFKVTEVWDIGRHALQIESPAMANGVYVNAKAVGLVKLPEHEKLTQVNGGVKYSFRAAIKILGITGKIKLAAVFNWYNIKGELVGTSESNELKAVGLGEVTAELVSPATAVAVSMNIRATSQQTSSEIKFLMDRIQLAPREAEGLAAYGDGDQPGWVWSSTPGESTSEQIELESDEQFIAAQRKLIEDSPSRERGTPAAIIAAAQKYLTGTKTVVLRERDGGPYRITVITYAQETPYENLVRQSLEEQVPGGIVMFYTTSESASYLLLIGYITYEAVRSAFKTYKGLSLNKPGE